ncbi:PREDICTED: odorant receptor 49b-like [Atta cephalotes]|uniref:Odorant receptor n=1 Tax=Atta cephalotes TaxID=12957 RepID=A0A158NR98_ATTCE|nr:PREDICTED: odorant receptor 49b-like [Atta cephalotes]
MHILKLNFKLLTIFGGWRPDSWSSLHKRVAYDMYTKLFILLMNRKNIIMLIGILMKEPCRPSRSTEIEILYKFDKSIHLYQISKTTTKAKYIEMTLYISSMLTQIFFYCWYGNEVKIKSHQMIDNIFEMEWLTLNKNKKKSLIIIMRRTIVPIQITCAYIIPMNLDSFMGILKTSYSTYNLLEKIRV